MKHIYIIFIFSPFVLASDETSNVGLAFNDFFKKNNPMVLSVSGCLLLLNSLVWAWMIDKWEKAKYEKERAKYRNSQGAASDKSETTSTKKSSPKSKQLSKAYSTALATSVSSLISSSPEPPPVPTRTMVPVRSDSIPLKTIERDSPIDQSPIVDRNIPHIELHAMASTVPLVKTHQHSSPMGTLIDEAVVVPSASPLPMVVPIVTPLAPTIPQINTKSQQVQQTSPMATVIDEVVMVGFTNNNPDLKPNNSGNNNSAVAQPAGVHPPSPMATMIEEAYFVQSPQRAPPAPVKPPGKTRTILGDKDIEKMQDLAQSFLPTLVRPTSMSADKSLKPSPVPLKVRANVPLEDPKENPKSMNFSQANLRRTGRLTKEIGETSGARGE